MSNPIPDPAQPIGNVTLVDDFLPPPDQLVPQKTTINASSGFAYMLKHSIDKTLTKINTRFMHRFK
jgi:hypothetical protein